ncbi:hypothetical protein Tco_0357309 [Tanacetum coccineum]
MSGETTVPRYMKFFLVQKIAESRSFVNRMCDEADTLRNCIAQLTVVIAELQAIEDQDEVHDSLLAAKLTAVIAELQAMEDQDEVHDSLLAAKDAKRGEQGKLTALNDVITEALDEIETQEANVEILDAGGNDV